MAANMDGWSPQPPPAAPAGFSFDKEFPGLHWHQRWELFNGVFTPGRNDVARLADFAGLPRDLRGLRVLDIGAWHGCFSFECERRGASEVVALTMEPDESTGFSRLAHAAGSRVVRNVPGTAYHLDQRELGHFDLVLFFGVLYHLRYPLLAVDNIRNICRGTVLIESHVIDDSWLHRRQPNAPLMPLHRLHPTLSEVPLWRYYYDGELLGDGSNFFGPNCQAVLDAFASAGFESRLIYRWGDRATFEAVAKVGLTEVLRDSYEIQCGTNRDFFQLAQGSPAPVANPPQAQLHLPPPPLPSPHLPSPPLPSPPRRLWQRALRKLLRTVGSRPKA
jgi:tRNA (mo5U34)-methyltransferase